MGVGELWYIQPIGGVLPSPLLRKRKASPHLCLSDRGELSSCHAGIRVMTGGKRDGGHETCCRDDVVKHVCGALRLSVELEGAYAAAVPRLCYTKVTVGSLFASILHIVFFLQVSGKKLALVKALRAEAALEDLDVVGFQHVLVQLAFFREPHLAFTTLDRLSSCVDLLVSLHVVLAGKQLATEWTGVVMELLLTRGGQLANLFLYLLT